MVQLIFLPLNGLGLRTFQVTFIGIAATLFGSFLFFFLQRTIKKDMIYRIATIQSQASFTRKR